MIILKEVQDSKFIERSSQFCAWWPTSEFFHLQGLLFQVTQINLNRHRNSQLPNIAMRIFHTVHHFFLYIYISSYIYLNTWHLGVPKFSFKRVRVLEIHPTQPRGGHPSHSNLVRGKLTSPTPNPAGDGTSGFTSYPRRRSKVSEATCLRPQRSAPSRTWTRAVQPRVQRSDHWATHASQCISLLQRALWSADLEGRIQLKSVTKPEK